MKTLKKRLRKFETAANYEAAKSGENFYTPCVSLVVDGYEIAFDPSAPVPPTPVVPNDEIWYTSSDGNIVEPNSTSALPTIVSNTYSEGKGIIKFDSNVTSIGDNAFYEAGLTSITLPSSVTTIGDFAFRGVNHLTITIEGQITSFGDLVFTDSGGSSNEYLDLTLLSTTPFDLVDGSGNVISFFDQYPPTELYIHVPAGYESTYATHDEGWEEIAPYIVGYTPAE